MSNLYAGLDDKDIFRARYADWSDRRGICSVCQQTEWVRFVAERKDKDLNWWKPTDPKQMVEPVKFTTTDMCQVCYEMRKRFEERARNHELIDVKYNPRQFHHYEYDIAPIVCTPQTLIRTV